MGTTLRYLILVVGLLVAATPARAVDVLPALARVGPWSHISGLIGYDGRLWFVNSVKFRNHNSADLYTYDPRSRAVRYERHLFSQDAGDPVIADGLLYWPFEDARVSLGWGHFQVTDGKRWRLGTVPTARIFHIHAMAWSGGRLVAATSAWRAGLQVSDDRGRTWREIYDHPTPQRRVSRIIELAAAGDTVFGFLIGRDNGRIERRLMRIRGDAVSEVPGWPHDRPLRAMAAFEGRLYGVVDMDEGTAVWSTNGKDSVMAAAPRRRWAVEDLAAGAGGLWAVSAETSGGLLWFSHDGSDWRVHRRVKGGEPNAVAVYGDVVYVAGGGYDGRGVLWGSGRATKGPAAAGALPSRREAESVDWKAAAAKLDAALSRPESYEQHGRILRDRVYADARRRPPGSYFADRLMDAQPDTTVSLIGGRVKAPATKLRRWILLWGMTLAGDGRVPPALIGEPWTASANGAEKYFETAPLAMTAAAALGQADRATLDALVDRLEQEGDPPWLKGDVVGALTALTDQRFAYDAAAWRRWWTEMRSDWR